MLRKRVVVLRGGPSPEYDVSMKTGLGVLRALEKLGHNAKDVVVTKNGDWLESGRIRRPEHILLAVDVVFIAMHGSYGEDGTVQRICESHHVAFTGSNSFQSRVAFNKDTTKRSLQTLPIKLPKHARVSVSDIPSLNLIVTSIKKSFGPEYVIKPMMSGSSDGVVMVGKTNDLTEKILESLTNHDDCLIEERIRGTEATCGILEDFRGESHYILPPVEVVPPSDREFFDYEVKYNGQIQEICPARFSLALREKIGLLAHMVHTNLNLSQYSRTDMIIKGDEVYFLEVNTLPGLTDESLFPKAASAVGLSYENLIDHLVRTAKVR